jgi:hypothetical protein
MSLFDSASLVVTPNGVKEGKLYSIKPTDGSGDLSVTRATTATRVNSAGLIEVVPRNLVRYSEQFDNATWTKYQSTITTNSINSPTGTLTADKIIPSAVSDIHYLRVFASPINLIAGVSIATYSIYAKQGEYYNFRLGTSASAGIGATFNLSNGTISNNTAISASIEDVGNGWYRCIIRGLVGSVLDALILNNAGSDTFAGNAVNGLFLWGAQIEETSTATDYYPTTTRLNIPRLDYTNGSCPSILVEPQRTNLYPYSNQLSQWSKSGTITITENNAISPDGTNNANRVQFTANSNLLFLSGTGLSGSNTLTIYAKAKNGVSAKFRFFANGATLFSSDQTATGEWQRFTFTYTYSALTAGLAGPTTGADDVLFYGFQHEVGSYATSYIPTTSASVTRNADVISKTGISSLIGQTEGTLFTDFKVNSLANFGTLISVNSNSLSNFIYVTVNSSGQLRVQLFNGTIQADIYSTVVVNNRYKLAFGYKTNDFVLYVNGVLIDSDVSGTTFSGTTLDTFDYNITIPTTFSNSSVSINSSALWKTRLTNAELAQLTTI